MSDSDEDDEERVEYFYDLVHRSPDVDDVLQELRKSSLLKAWRVDLRCRLLLSSEVDSLLDPNVVDWNDFHLSYLESISKHRGTNKKNAVLRSHDQVDDLEALSDRLMKEHPGFVADGSMSKKNEWQSCIGTLVIEFQRIVNNCIHNGNSDLPTKVREILANPFVPTDKKHGETMYYLAGAVMKIISNLSHRSKDVYSSALDDIRTNALTSKEEARNDCLPLAKVEAKEIVNLCYVNEPFFNLVLKIESVFHTLLSEDSIAAYGIRIVADIVMALGMEDLGFDDFFSQPHDDDVKVEVIRRILFSYGRIRGKDFVRKTSAKDGAKNHETLRSALGTATAIAENKAKKAKDKEEQSPRMKYLLKQRKKDLVSMCKNRKVHLSGTKKTLAARIIECDKTTQSTNSNSSQVAPSLAILDDENDQHLLMLINDMDNETQVLSEGFDVIM